MTCRPAGGCPSALVATHWPAALSVGAPTIRVGARSWAAGSAAQNRVRRTVQGTTVQGIAAALVIAAAIGCLTVRPRVDGGVRTAGVVWRQRCVAATPCGRQCRVVASTERSVIVSKYRGSPWIVLIVMSLGFFMTLLDLTIVNIAIPDMITRLHATLDGVLWVINAYALVLAVLLITAGRLGDLFGQRRLFIIGVILFTLSSAACGFSPSVGWLVAFRAIQGVGAALLLPQTLAILTTVFPPEPRGAALPISVRPPAVPPIA